LEGGSVTIRERPSRPDAAVLWGFAAVMFWGVMTWLGVTMFTATPRIAAFDLDLLVGAGRAIASGQQPYDPRILQGLPPDATGLFYSYPPIVGQALVPIAALPLGLLAIAWAVISIGGLAAVVVLIRDRLGATTRTSALVAGTVAVSAMTLPMLVAVLFGNLDAIFPALYGLILVAAISPRRSEQAAGGGALALGGLTKVYPGALGLWFLVRWLRDRRLPDARRSLVPIGAALAVAVVVLGLSVLLFGVRPWQDYSTVAATAARAELVDHRNDAPAAQLALWLGASSDTARLLHLPVLALAVLVIAGAAWRVRDPLESLAIAATASLFVLPISWVHYPAVLIPFGIAAAIRVEDARARNRISTLLAAALVIGALSILWLPLLWIAIVLTLGAVHGSAASPSAPVPARTVLPLGGAV
jgi:hypothetical protein